MWLGIKISDKCRLRMMLRIKLSTCNFEHYIVQRRAARLLMTSVHGGADSDVSILEVPSHREAIVPV